MPSAPLTRSIFLPVFVRSRLFGPRAAGAAFVTHEELNELDQWSHTTHTRTPLAMRQERRA